ncbi:ROK family protein [Streptomyces sp. 8L]|uniref:ROK family protein n=1 Tax=Streptomyces sp. 8L TaxID=2877242 RepID=UPI001CD78DCA|nr:ROK family protein [Streptomyces sp. 8L]MCA1220422.1 ROK family protein [Streptomyces sp. 8L]
MRQPSDFTLTERELAELGAWAEGREDRTVRVRIVRDAAAGLSVSRSARELGVSRPTVTAWRQRYAELGLAGLEHRPRSGRPPRIDEADVVAVTLAGPPPPLRHWSARSLADHLGLSHTALGRVWQRWAAGPASGEGPVLLPTDPPLACHRPELLAAWTGADGSAGVVVAEPERPERHRTVAATGEERQLRHAALTVGLRQAQLRAAHAPLATAPGQPAFPPGALGDRHVRVILWGEDAGTVRLPQGAIRHVAHQAMGWSSTVSVMAQLELRHQPHRARGALDSLTEAARVHAGARADEPFRWQRSPDGAAEPPPSRSAHRAFDQLALGSFNEKLVIESIRVAGTLSRVEIADRTGLTPQAVSRITRNLLTTGFLTEDERRSAGKGKPRVPLRLRPDAACAIGIHVDPEMITQVLVDLCGTVRDRRQLPLTAPSDPAWCVERMARMAAEASRAVGPLADNLLGAGVAAPGPLDVGAGLLLDPPLFEGWGEVPLRARLGEALGMPVLLEKDATAAAVGERWLGAAESSGDFVYLYLGAGAGSGAFLNGDVFRGSSGNAGEFGELTAYALGRLTPEGGPQMIPECAPMSAVVAKAAAAGLTVPAEGAHAAVCAAAAGGDPRAAAAIREVAQVVARGAVGMTDLYDTDLLIVGGPAVPPEVAELYLSEISSAVNRFPMARRVRRVRVAYSTLGDAAAAVGAAAGVFHTTFAPRLRSHAGASV